jgi:hypothetical protein
MFHIAVLADEALSCDDHICHDPAAYNLYSAQNIGKVLRIGAKAKP